MCEEGVGWYAHHRLMKIIMDLPWVSRGAACLVILEISRGHEAPFCLLLELLYTIPCAHDLFDSAALQ